METIRNELIPMGMSDDDFEPIFNRVVERVGHNMARTYLAMLSHANLVTLRPEIPKTRQRLAGEKFYKPSRIRIIYPGAIYADFAIDISGRELTAINHDSDDVPDHHLAGRNVYLAKT
ncbi:MAG: hypothetical protein R3C05_28210 [Pirellulaceae bacterium]